MSDIAKSKPHKLIEKTLNIFDEGTKTAAEQFAFNDVYGGRATIELPRNVSRTVRTVLDEALLRNADLPYGKAAEEAAESAIKSKPKRFARRLPHVGWQTDEDGRPNAFVLGPIVLRPNNTKEKLLAPSWLNDCLLLIPPKTGSLEAWQEEVAKPALKSSRLMLAISCSFAAMVIRLSAFPNFGVNLYGPSKCGKSTALLAGTSVYGIGREEDLANWAATTAAAYETARVYNDLMMPINETGLIKGSKKDAYTAISNWIFSYSEGRDRSKHSGNQYASKQSSARWHGIFFATSEWSFEEFARTAGAERVGGEYARCTDVPALPVGYDTIFDNFDDTLERATRQWARKELERFRRECSKNRGVAAYAFICSLPKDWDKHPAFIERKVTEFVDAVNGSRLTDAKHHAAKNFGIIYAGACLAIKKGILPWKSKYLLESLRACFMDAMGCISTSDDILTAGQEKLREALQQSKRWPHASNWPKDGKGFVKPEGGRMSVADDMSGLGSARSVR